MSEPTPGPWRALVTRTGQELYPSVCGDGGRFVADTWHYQQEEAEMVANAHLIAAAPDLLAACELALGTLGQMSWAEHSGCPAALACIEAIGKARGEVGQ